MSVPLCLQQRSIIIDIRYVAVVGSLVRQMIGADKPITNTESHFAIQHHHFEDLCYLHTKY
jgi:hypothetical protein